MVFPPILRTEQATILRTGLPPMHRTICRTEQATTPRTIHRTARRITLPPTRKTEVIPILRTTATTDKHIGTVGGAEKSAKYRR